MRTNLALFAICFALTAVACSDSTGSSSTNLCDNSGAAATVSATDQYVYTPSSVTITVGQSVCWQNTGKLDHTVSDGVRFNAPLPSGQTFVHTFGFGGTFTIHCAIHDNMTGTVEVKCKPGDISC